MNLLDLPEGIYEKYILNHINDTDRLFNLMQVNKFLYQNTLLKYEYMYKYDVFKFTPPHIVKLFGTIDNLISHPILTYKRHFLGRTAYIDKIKPDDVKFPIMIGVDNYDRKFITFKLNYKANEDVFNIKKDEETQIVTTLFQRFTNDRLKWVFGSYYNRDCMYRLHQQVLPTEEDLSSYEKVINGEDVKVNNFIINRFID